MTATAQARKLLSAARGRLTIPEATKEVRDKAPATLAVAITLAEALRNQPCSTWDMPDESCEASDCDRCKALAEWEKLFP